MTAMTGDMPFRLRRALAGRLVVAVLLVVLPVLLLALLALMAFYGVTGDRTGPAYVFHAGPAGDAPLLRVTGIVIQGRGDGGESLRLRASSLVRETWNSPLLFTAPDFASGTAGRPGGLQISAGNALVEEGMVRAGGGVLLVRDGLVARAGALETALHFPAGQLVLRGGVRVCQAGGAGTPGGNRC